MSQNDGLEGSVAVLLSGGLDSAIVLAIVCQQARRVVPIYVQCGLTWERQELHAVETMTAWFPQQVLPVVKLAVSVEAIYGPHWSLTGQGVPAADSPDDAVLLPGRNLLLLALGGLWCIQNGCSSLAMGILDSNPFPDATPTFLRDVERVLSHYRPPHVRLVKPLAGLSKSQVLMLGRHLPLHETFSCIAPIDGQHCGKCNKCSERQNAFRQAGLADKTTYATPSRDNRQ